MRREGMCQDNRRGTGAACEGRAERALLSMASAGSVSVPPIDKGPGAR